MSREGAYSVLAKFCFFFSNISAPPGFAHGRFALTSHCTLSYLISPHTEGTNPELNDYGMDTSVYGTRGEREGRQRKEMDVKGENKMNEGLWEGRSLEGCTWRKTLSLTTSA